MGLKVVNCPSGSTEERVSTAALPHGLDSGTSGFWMTDKLGQITRYESFIIQSGMDAVSPIQTRLSSETDSIIDETYVVLGTPP